MQRKSGFRKIRTPLQREHIVREIGYIDGKNPILTDIFVAENVDNAAFSNYTIIDYGNSYAISEDVCK